MPDCVICGGRNAGFARWYPARERTKVMNATRRRMGKGNATELDSEPEREALTQQHRAAKGSRHQLPPAPHPEHSARRQGLQRPAPVPRRLSPERLGRLVPLLVAFAL